MTLTRVRRLPDGSIKVLSHEVIHGVAAQASSGTVVPSQQPPRGAVQRSYGPTGIANARELQVRPDADGRVSFRFHSQPWDGVLAWFADISQMGLLLDDVPAGTIDLAANCPYRLDEVRDLLGSVLLSKGFTLLCADGQLVATRVAHLRPEIVPGISLSELDRRGAYEFVKVSIDLDGILAKAAAEELQPLLGPSGRITAMPGFNRVEILDVVGNIRRIRELLTDDQQTTIRKPLVREFRLRHTPAANALGILRRLLGMEQTEETRFAASQRSNAVARQTGLAGTGDATVRLAANRRRNSVLACAPADRMKLIERAVAAIDAAPTDRTSGAIGNHERRDCHLPRRFEAIALRKVDAAEVANLVVSFMQGTDPAADRDAPASSNAREFAIEADAAGNRLLLRANDAELAEIRRLLTKMGEAAAGDSRDGSQKVVQVE
jgi:type II secretory pathway component GspD/PulD (secretin)